MTNLDVPASGDGEFYQEMLGSPIQQVTSRDQEEAFVWKFHRQQSCSVQTVQGRSPADPPPLTKLPSGLPAPSASVPAMILFC